MAKSKEDFIKYVEDNYLLEVSYDQLSVMGVGLDELKVYNEEGFWSIMTGSSIVYYFKDRMAFKLKEFSIRNAF